MADGLAQRATGSHGSMQLTPKDYKSDVENTWCPGCGDFGVLSALYQTFAKLQIPQKDLLIVSGIGCSGRLPVFVSSYSFHVVHGRALPVALGAKMGNPDLHVVVVGGDGDAYGIGGGHIPHVARRNSNLTYIVMDNSTYGLTKVQVSPTSPRGKKSGSTPYGSYEEPINPIAMAITYGASFVARAFSGKLQEMVDIYSKAMQHPGFSIINTLSPCVTFYNTYKDWAAATQPLPADYDKTDKMKALEWAFRTDKLWTGIFYQQERQTFEDAIHATVEKAEKAGHRVLQEIMAKFD